MKIPKKIQNVNIVKEWGPGPVLAALGLGGCWGPSRIQHVNEAARIMAKAVLQVCLACVRAWLLSARCRGLCCMVARPSLTDWLFWHPHLAWQQLLTVAWSLAHRPLFNLAKSARGLCARSQHPGGA